MQSRSLLKQGIKWIVGDGRKIRVWEDNWIHSQPATPAFGAGKDTFPQCTVRDLMIQGTRKWNEQFINNIIRQEDAQYILNIRTSSRMGQDTPIWGYTKSGEYTVRSGYYIGNQIMKHQNGEGQSSCGLPEDIKMNCSAIWSLSLPPKLKTFWWRILHDGLPVAENLRKRNIQIDNTCQMCEEYSESQLHLLFQCRVTKEIWFLAPMTFQMTEGAQANIQENIRKLIALAKEDTRELLNFYIGWRIWKKRNNLIYQQRQEHIVKIIHDAIRELSQWEHANNYLTRQDGGEVKNRKDSLQFQQTMPVRAQYYCQVDASWENSKEKAGVGWSLHGIQGNQMLRGSSSIQATNTPMEAEAEALRMAVEQLRVLAFSRVHFISDCKNLMDELAQYMSGATIGQVRNTEIISMIHDIVAASRANDYTFSYVPRSSLSLVDEIAKKARCNHHEYVITWF